MRTITCIFFLILAHFGAGAQGIVRPFEDLEDYRVLTSPFEQTLDVMEVDEEGNVWVAGTFVNTLTSRRVGDVRYTLNSGLNRNAFFLLKMDANLEVEWGKVIEYADSSWTAVQRIRFDGAGNAIVQGYYGGYLEFDDGTRLDCAGGLGGSDVFFAKVDPSGTWQDIWEIKGPAWLNCGDFREMEDGTWRVGLSRVQLPVWIDNDTITPAESPGGANRITIVDIVLSPSKVILNQEFIFPDGNGTIGNFAQGYVTPDGSIIHYFFLLKKSGLNRPEPRLWAGEHYSDRQGWRIIQSNPEGKIRYISRGSKIEENSPLNGIKGSNGKFFIAGSEYAGTSLKIIEFGELGRRKQFSEIQANLGDFITDMEWVGENEIWISGWYAGKIRGNGWEVGYDVGGIGFQPISTFLISLNVSRDSVNWVISEPLKRDRSELKQIEPWKSILYLHTTWRSDTISIDTLRLNDIGTWPKELICKLKLPQLQEVNEIDNSLVVWPNPANEYFWMYGGKTFSQGSKWQIVDNKGKIIHQGNYKGFSNLYFDIRNYSEGLYHFIIINSNSTFSKKILINH